MAAPEPEHARRCGEKYGIVISLRKSRLLPHYEAAVCRLFAEARLLRSSPALTWFDSGKVKWRW
jgi:hypothetical protein